MPEDSLQPWINQFINARKPTRDVLTEYGFLAKDTDNFYNVSEYLQRQPLKDLMQLFPNANLFPNERMVLTPEDVSFELQQLVRKTCSIGIRIYMLDRFAL